MSISVELTRAFVMSSLKNTPQDSFTSMASRSVYGPMCKHMCIHVHSCVFMCKHVLIIQLQKHIEIKERPLCKKALDSSDVFILDLGLTIYQVGIWIYGEVVISV